MKRLFIVFMAALTIIACRPDLTGDDDNGGSRSPTDFDIHYQNVQKIAVTGLPAINRFGKNVELEVMYFPTGKIPSISDELSVVTYTEAGEYLFPDGIDIYWVGHSEGSPMFYYQGYEVHAAFEEDTGVYTCNFRKPNSPGFDVRKITLHGLPAVTSSGKAVEYSIHYRETFKELPPSAPNGFQQTFTESGVYEFPDGIDIFLCGITVDTDEYFVETPEDDECLTIYIKKKSP